MMPSDFRHQNISIFADLASLKREERARRRLLRIQQVRQQAKVVATQVISHSRHLRKKEQCLLQRKREEKLKQWKQTQLKSLHKEFNHGLEVIGTSYKAVEEELAQISEKKKLREEQERLAYERGLAAARAVQQDLEIDRLNEERKLQDRAELRTLEKLRAKAVASLPPSASTLPQRSSKKSTEDSNKKVEFYNFGQPLPSQFRAGPDSVVQKVSPRNCKVGAVEAAKKELELYEVKDQERTKQNELISWLGGAAECRLALEKEYTDLAYKLKILGQREAQTKPDDTVTLFEIAKIEREYKIKRRGQKMSEQNAVPPSNVAATSSECMPAGYDVQDTALPRQDLTAYPLAQFTAEERGALGGTAPSLYALLSSLSDESRRRLQAVVDDDFVFNDDDLYDEMSPSPPESPEPQLQSGKDTVTVDVKSTQQVIVEGPSSPASITSEVSITVASKSKNKRRKKKAKNKETAVDETSRGASKEKPSPPTKDKGCQSEIPEPSSSSAKQYTHRKTVEIDENGVAFIKKTVTTTERGQQTSILHQDSTDQIGKSCEEDSSLKYNKHSFVSNSTQYHSPPESMLANENIEKYLRSIEMEKEQVEALLKSKSRTTQTSTDINLPQYINKLLTMTRDSVEQLSVSDVTETSSEISKTGHKKKKKRRKSKSTSSSSANTPSTEDSHVTLSVPSPGTPCSSAVAEKYSSSSQTFSSSCEDSKLKFSESSSLKESSGSDPKQTKENSLDSTAYLSLHDLSSRAVSKPTLVPEKISSDAVDTSTIPTVPDDEAYRPARLSTIIEGDSSVITDDESLTDKQGEKDYSSDTTLDIDAELRRRGLPTLKAHASASAADKLLSPELERHLQDMKVAPWGTNMIARMKKADERSSSSEGSLPRFSDPGTRPPTTEHGISHSTPVSMEDRVTARELSNGSQTPCFFRQDPIVSPIPSTEE